MSGQRHGRNRPGAARPPRSKRQPTAGREALDPERMVYGRHPLRELIRAGRRSIRHLFATASAADAVREWLPAGVHPSVVEPADLDALAGSGDHQGVVAHVDGYPYTSLDEIVAGEAPLVVALDEVTDPHNLGAIARLVDATGGSGILLPQRRSVSVTAAACKASAGALEHIRVARCRNLADALIECRERGAWIYGASERAQQNYIEPDYSGPAVLVLGSEGAGLRPRVREQCDVLVSIPLQGRVSSLNVATAGAVLLYEMHRQRHTAG